MALHILLQMLLQMQPRLILVLQLDLMNCRERYTDIYSITISHSKAENAFTVTRQPHVKTVQHGPTTDDSATALITLSRPHETQLPFKHNYDLCISWKSLCITTDSEFNDFLISASLPRIGDYIALWVS